MTMAMIGCCEVVVGGVVGVAVGASVGDATVAKFAVDGVALVVDSAAVALPELSCVVSVVTSCSAPSLVSAAVCAGVATSGFVTVESSSFRASRSAPGAARSTRPSNPGVPADVLAVELDANEACQEQPRTLHRLLDVRAGERGIERSALRQHLRHRRLQFRRQRGQIDRVEIGEERRQAVLLGRGGLRRGRHHLCLQRRQRATLRHARQRQLAGEADGGISCRRRQCLRQRRAGAERRGIGGVRRGRSGLLRQHGEPETVRGLRHRKF